MSVRASASESEWVNETSSLARVCVIVITQHCYYKYDWTFGNYTIFTQIFSHVSVSRSDSSSVTTMSYSNISYSNYILAGFSSCGATIFTNPLEASIQAERAFRLWKQKMGKRNLLFLFGTANRWLKHDYNCKVNWKNWIPIWKSIVVSCMAYIRLADMMVLRRYKRDWFQHLDFNSVWILCGECITFVRDVIDWNACVPAWVNASTWPLRVICIYRFFSFHRLGVYDTATALGWTRNRNGHMSFWLGYFWGGLSG